MAAMKNAQQHEPKLVWVSCSKCGVRMLVNEDSPLYRKEVGHLISRGKDKGSRCEGRMEVSK